VPANDPRIKPKSSVSSVELAPLRIREGLGIAAKGVF
jgi:hypothetical protein